jgi:hypothetical protein
MSDSEPRTVRRVWWRRLGYVLGVIGAANIYVGGNSHLIVGGVFLLLAVALLLGSRKSSSQSDRLPGDDRETPPL